MVQVFTVEEGARGHVEDSYIHVFEDGTGQVRVYRNRTEINGLFIANKQPTETINYTGKGLPYVTRVRNFLVMKLTGCSTVIGFK